MNMKRYFAAGSGLLAALLFSACSSTGDADGASSAATPFSASENAAVEVTVSDEELQATTLQIVAGQDEQNLVAPEKSKYAKRLAGLTRKLVNEDDLSLNFLIYLSTDVNVFATPDGSIRIYSGLLDLLNDDELRSVLGHVIGHVKLGHSLDLARTAYLASNAGKIAEPERVLSIQTLDEVGEKFLHAHYSRSQELAADVYAVEFLKRHKYKLPPAESALRKLAKVDGAVVGHPGARERADDVHTLVTPEKKATGKKPAGKRKAKRIAKKR
jgi:putative metalloprotease